LGCVGQALHQAFGHIGLEVALDALEGVVDTEHEDLLSMVVAFATAIMPGGPCFD
jgi:hypothetical protein